MPYLLGDRRNDLRVQLRLQAAHERRMLRDMASELTRVVDEAAADIEESGRLLGALESHDARVEQALVAGYNGVMPAFGQRILDAATDRRFAAPREFKQAQTEFDRAMQKWISLTAALKVRQISETTRDQIRAKLEAGRREGLGTDALARSLRDTLGGTTARLRAAIIARTETHAAAQAANRQAADATGIRNLRKEWLAADDARTRPDHNSADGQIVAKESTFTVGGSQMEQPGDPSAPTDQVVNCFVPGTVVGGRFVGGLKARYSGPILEITTARGNRLSVTPNHPILTRHRGFVPAKSILEGENLVAYIGRAPVGGKHEDKTKALIENVFDSIGSQGAVCALRINGADLHGDAEFSQNQINVVRAKRVLLVDMNPVRPKIIRQLVFGIRGVGTRLVSALGASAECFQRFLHPSPSVVSGHHSLFALGFGYFRPFKQLGIRPPSQWNATLQEPAGQCLSADLDFVRKLLHRHPREVSFDKVVEVRRSTFSGHVYDLQSEGGWIAASNIITSNCRCAQAFLTED